MIKITQISTSDALYEAERELRNEVLLRPIGLPDHAWEMKDHDSYHLVATREDVVVGCALLWPSPDRTHTAQLLQMAVSAQERGTGVGRDLVDAVKKQALSVGVKLIWCHARSNVVEFYRKLGFRAVGEAFTEVGIAHRRMEFLCSA